MPGLEITGGSQFAALARDLRAAGDPRRGLRRRATAAITVPARAAQSEIQARVRAIPTHGDRHTGLRDRVAALTKIKALVVPGSAAVRVYIDADHMPEGQQSLPKLLNGDREWEHPLFGNRNYLYKQKPHPFVDAVAERLLLSVSRALVATVNETATTIEKGRP